MRRASIFFYILIGSGIVTCKTESIPITEIPSPFADRLLADEKKLAQTLPGYRDLKTSAYFYPTGIYFEDDTVWAYSKIHPRQSGFRYKAGKWEKAGERLAPIRTMRCIEIPEAICLGYYDGPVAMKTQRSLASVPSGGFEDLTYEKDTGALYALNSLRNVLHIIYPKDGRAKTIGIRAGSYLIGTAGKNRLWVASHLNPRLYFLQADTGIVTHAVNLTAPVRHATYDAKSDTLWTIGPENKAVSRKNGIIENLRTAVYGYAAATGKLTHEIFWNNPRLVDGNALTVSGDYLYASAGGSAMLWRYDLKTGTEELSGTNAVPRSVIVHGNQIGIATYLGDSINFFIPDGNKTRVHSTLQLSGKKAIPATRKGEYLFYQTGMWADTAANAYTCNSCHWDGLTDHRMQPGFHETRYEMTRPVAGIGLVHPVFTPMQAESLSQAVEGLFRGLDVRYWQRAASPPYYLRPVKIRISPTENIELEAGEARQALLAALMAWPVEPPASRKPGNALTGEATEGLRIFQRDCARCHEATSDMRSRVRKNPASLQTSPIVFGSPFYAKSGIEPYYTPHGNRISPLINLGRGGPFFSNGSAADLAEVVRMSSPAAKNVHSPANAKAPFYDGKTSARLLAFLLSI